MCMFAIFFIYQIKQSTTKKHQSAFLYIFTYIVCEWVNLNNRSYLFQIYRCEYVQYIYIYIDMQRDKCMWDMIMILRQVIVKINIYHRIGEDGIIIFIIAVVVDGYHLAVLLSMLLWVECRWSSCYCCANGTNTEHGTVCTCCARIVVP